MFCGEISGNDVWIVCDVVIMDLGCFSRSEAWAVQIFLAALRTRAQADWGKREEWNSLLGAMAL
jgi:hypothetical protein